MNSTLPRSCVLAALLLLLFSIHLGGALQAQASKESPETLQPSGASTSDKSGYNLLNPTPPDKMRDFETDRPDKTESPYTIDAGHFAVESGILSYTYNHITQPDPTRPQHQFLVGENNFKVGLLNNMDLQLIVQSFIWQKMKTGAHTSSEESGFGDIETRLKINVWGNDGGKTAFAIMPWLGLPTNQLDSSNKVTGGVILPLAIKGPWGWKIGTQTELDAIDDTIGSGHHLEWVNTIVFEHDIIKEKLDGYIEFFSNNSFETGKPWAGTVDLGLIYEVNKNLFLDCGVNIGVTSDADDLNSFIGFSKRF